MMRFSVITVCRNSAHCISRAKASLAEQRFADYEWVVIDGDSSDATLALVSDFKAAPLEWVSEPDNGIYDAMNKAVGIARGQYLFFLNSDDQLADANVLQSASDAIDAAYEPDLLVGRVLFESAHGSRQVLDFSHLTKTNVFFNGICHQGVFAHRSTFKRFGLFDISYRMAADFDWLCRVMRGGGRVVFSKFNVAVFADGGAHAQARSLTHAESLQIRARQLGFLERIWTHSRLWVDHKTKRLLGLRHGGRATASNDVEDL